jgi:hypothetical protein
MLTWLTACGGTDYSGPPKQDQAVGQAGCRSPQLSSDRRLSTPARSPGQTFSVDLSDLTSAASRVSLTPRQAAVVDRVEDRFTDRGTYRPARGYRFVAVTFTFGNAGKDEIEAANSVGNIFVLATRGGRAWQRVDRTDGCTTVSSSLAAVEKVTDPEAEVKPGGRYTTVIVYAVPESASPLVWYGAGDAVAIEPKDTG